MSLQTGVQFPKQTWHQLSPLLGCWWNRELNPITPRREFQNHFESTERKVTFNCLHSPGELWGECGANISQPCHTCTYTQWRRKNKLTNLLIITKLYTHQHTHTLNCSTFENYILCDLLLQVWRFFLIYLNIFCNYHMNFNSITTMPCFLDYMIIYNQPQSKRFFVTVFAHRACSSQPIQERLGGGGTACSQFIYFSYE